MKADQVIKQLQSVLPSTTDLFTDSQRIVNLTYLNGIVTCITENDHGLDDGYGVTVHNTINTINISSITRNGTIARVVTDTDHDFTYGVVERGLGGKVAELSGSNEPEFNGAFEMLSVINRRTFDIAMADAGPTASSGQSVVENGAQQPGFNGKQVITATDTNKFTYPVNQILSPSAILKQEFNPAIKAQARVSGAITVGRAVEAYTSQGQGKLWAFVVLGDVIASKDRKVMSDLSSTAKRNTAWNQRLSQPFTVYVFTSTVEEHAGREARDLMEDVFICMNKSLLGVAFDTGLTSNDQYVTTFLNHGFSAYTNAYYIHEFNYECAADIVSDDIVDIEFNTAFRDINISITSQSGDEPATASVNLDDEPL